MPRLTHLLLLLLLAAAAAASTPPTISVCPDNSTRFCVDGAPTHAGRPLVEGLFLNSRMIQGVFEDNNASTVGLWAYPGGSVFSPDRQTDELVGNLSAYAACGLDGFTVGLQGGGPLPATPMDQPNETPGFSSDGTPLPGVLARLSRVLDGAAAAGLIPIVSLFYQGQIERINGDAAVATAVDAMVDWLVSTQRAGHVMLEIANEVGQPSFPPSLQPDSVHLLIERARARSNDTLLVSASFNGGVVPPDSALAASSHVTIHCNGETPEGTAVHVNAVRATAAWQASPKPIFFNECSTNISVMEAAISAGAGWGLYSQGLREYAGGYQTPPTNWLPDSSPVTEAFFARVAAYAGKEGACSGVLQGRV
jgi:hypothetical protein